MEQEEDIVERLRRNDLSDNASGVPCVLCCEAADEIEWLRGALKGMTARYCELVNSGDCGFWNPEEEDEVKHARSALGKQRGSKDVPNDQPFGKPKGKEVW